MFESNHHSCIIILIIKLLLIINFCCCWSSDKDRLEEASVARPLGFVAQELRQHRACLGYKRPVPCVRMCVRARARVCVCVVVGVRVYLCACVFTCVRALA